MTCNLLNKGCLTLVLTAVALIVMSTPLYSAENKQDTEMTAHDYILDRQQSFNCSMVQMKDDELSDVTAAGFSSFTLNDLTGVTRAYLNIEAQTFTEIQSLKMGYYNGGWDEEWAGVSLGSSTESLTCKGLYIEAGFTDIANSTGNRNLDFLRVGTPSMTGPITANFNSFSGCIKTAGVTDPIVNQSRGPINSGDLTTIYSNPGHNNDNSEFFMQLSKTGTAGTSNVPAAQAGWWFYWSNATVTRVP